MLCLFFAPLAATVPPYATAPALIFVATLMMRSVADLSWDDLTETVPAIVTIVAMPLTFSIATGIGFGFITYAGIKLLSGRVREISPSVAVIAGLFLLKFAIL